MKATRISSTWQIVARLSRRRLITFLIGNHQYSICRPFFISVLANQLFFYLLLLFCITHYIRPNDIFTRVTFPWGLYRLFTIVGLFQACLLIAGLLLSIVLHISLVKGNTNYLAARAKRLVFYLLTSIRLIYAFGSSFLLLHNAIRKEFLLFFLHSIVMILTFLYFVVFNYMSLFYASTTLVLSPAQYFLTNVVPHIVAFVMGPLYIAYIYFMRGFSNWVIASRCIHMFVFIFIVYCIIVNCIVPFCSFLTPVVIAILCVLSGINLAGLAMTIVPVPVNHFIVYINVILCWAFLTFLLCYSFVTRKYRREQAAIVRLHNGDYTYSGVSLTPEMLYNSLLLFTSYIKRVAITDGRFYIALENICLCYIIALYSSLELDSMVNKAELCDDKPVVQQPRGCISKCSKQKRLGYICLIFDMLDCEILQTLLDVPKEEDPQGELHRTAASASQDRRIIYEVNMYLLETFSMLVIFRGIGCVLTNQLMSPNSEHESTNESQNLRKQERTSLDTYTHPCGQCDEIAKSSMLINTHRYHGESTNMSVENPDPTTIDVSDVDHSGLNAPSLGDSGAQLKLASSGGKEDAANCSKSMLPHSTNKACSKSHIPLYVHRYSGDNTQDLLRDRKKKRHWPTRWTLSIYQDLDRSKNAFNNLTIAPRDCQVKLQQIVRQLSPQFLQDLVFDPSEMEVSARSVSPITGLLETLLYSCCGFILVKVKIKDLCPQFRRVYDPSKLFYLDDTPPQEMYKQQGVSDNQSASFKSTTASFVVASPYFSMTKDVSAVFNEQINPDVTPILSMKRFQGPIRKPNRSRAIRYLILDGLYEFISQPMNNQADPVEYGYADFLDFVPPIKYKYFANPRLANTRPMNICSCMIINSILSRILENADTCLTNIDRITKLSNNLKRDSHFSTARFEELMMLCNRQNAMYQDIVEQAKRLYIAYPYCVTATHTLAWVYHELYNAIWPLNQLSIFPFIDHIHPSLTSKELSTLNSSLLHSEGMMRRVVPSDASEDSSSISSQDDSTDNSSHDLAISPSNTPEERQATEFSVSSESDIKASPNSSTPSQQESTTQRTSPTIGTFSTLSLSSFGQTHTKSVLMDNLSRAPLMQHDSYDESIRTVRNYIQNFIITQDRSVQSFYIAYTAEGSIVILPPCLSYCHYAVVDSPSSLKRCEYRTYTDIKGAEVSPDASPVSINIVNQMAMVSAAINRPSYTNSKGNRRLWRSFFTTGFSGSLVSKKISAKRFVRTLLNKHQDIIRPITIFNLENFAYIVTFLLAFAISLVVIIRANRVFLYNDYITEAASVFTTVVQTDEIFFMRIYDTYSKRVADGEPTESLFTSKELEDLYYLSRSSTYEIMSQKIYNLGLDLEQHAFAPIHPFYHVLKVSNKMVSFIPTPVPMRIYGTIVFQNPYRDMLICFQSYPTLVSFGFQDTDHRHLIIKCIQSKIEGVRSNIYINIVPFVWNSLFTMTTTSLLIQNFSTHFKVLILALAGVVGFCLIFAFSSYNIFLVRLQNLSDLLLNLLSRTGARFDYRLLFAQFYFKERINFACQNVKYTPTFEHLVSLHSETITEKDNLPKKLRLQSYTSQAPKVEVNPRPPLTADAESLSSDGSSSRRSESNSVDYTSSYLGNEKGKICYTYDYSELVEMHKLFSAQYDKPSLVWAIAKVFVLLCMGISIVLLYIFHSFPIVSYTETGLGPYYASVIESMRYPHSAPETIFVKDDWNNWNDNTSMVYTTPIYQTVGDVIAFEKCLQKATSSLECQKYQSGHKYIDSSDHIAYASPQWRLTWIRQNYALLQDVILDTILSDLSISQHASLTPAQPGTEPYKLYYTCSRAVKNPHLAPFVLDRDIRFADVTKKLIYLYTMSLRSPSYDYYSMILNQYSNTAGKYVSFVLDYGASSSPPSTFKESEYKAALLLPSFASYEPILNQQDFQKTTIGTRAFIELQKSVYNNSFSILQPSYNELRGKDSCTELTAFHSMLLMNSIIKQRGSTAVNRNLDEKNITTEHLFSLILLLSFVPIGLLVVYHFSTSKVKILKKGSQRRSDWVDLYSYKILSRIFAAIVLLITTVILTIIIVSLTQFFNNKVAISHMTRIYLSSSQLNSLGLQLIESLGSYNMQLASLEWDDTKQAYSYKCENVYVALQRPVMLNTQFHLVDAVDNIKPFTDADQMLELYYNLRHAAFSVNIALARMCTLPKEVFPEKNQPYTADVYLDELFNFSKPTPDRRYSSYYEDYSICTDSTNCVDIYSYARLKSLADKDLHLYLKSVSKGSNILLKGLLSFSHEVEMITNSLTRQILAIETKINNFLVLMQRIISWLLVVHVILMVLLYIYLQFMPTRSSLVVFKIMATHKHSLALHFGLTVGSFAILIIILLISLLISLFKVDVVTTDGKSRWTETALYNSLGNIFINSRLMNATLAILQNTDLTYEETHISELYTRVQNLNEYARIAKSAATMLLPGFSYTNATGTYDVKDLLLNYTTGILIAAEDVQKKIWDSASTFDQRIRLSDVYERDDYLGIANLTSGDIHKIMERYATPLSSMTSVKLAVSVVYGVMIGAFLAYTTYTIIMVRREVSSILTILNTIPVADLVSFKEMSSGIFSTYNDILSFVKLA